MPGVAAAAAAVRAGLFPSTDDTPLPHRPRYQKRLTHLYPSMAFSSGRTMFLLIFQLSWDIIYIPRIHLQFVLINLYNHVTIITPHHFRTLPSCPNFPLCSLAVILAPTSRPRQPLMCLPFSRNFILKSHIVYLVSFIDYVWDSSIL